MFTDGDDDETPAEYRRLYDLGVDGIMTSRPRALNAHLCVQGDRRARTARSLPCPPAVPAKKKKKCKKGKKLKKGKCVKKKRKKKGKKRAGEAPLSAKLAPPRGRRRESPVAARAASWQTPCSDGQRGDEPG